MIKTPTRETIDTLIDHIAVSNERNIIESGVFNLNLGNHYLVYVIRKFRGNIINDRKHIKTCQMKKYNEEQFLSDSANINWQRVVCSLQNINQVVLNWTKLLSFIIEKHALLTERRVYDKFTPWLTSAIKFMFRARDKLKAAVIKTKSMVLIEAYKRIQNNALKCFSTDA